MEKTNMQIESKKKEHDGCFLYWRNKKPFCLLTHLMTVSKWFDNDQEAIEFSSFDCGGNLKFCPYVKILWKEDSDKIEEGVIENNRTHQAEEGVIENNRTHQAEEEKIIEDTLLQEEDNIKGDSFQDDEEAFDISNRLEDSIFTLGDITLDFDYSMPFDTTDRTDALLIPTNVNFLFDKFFDFHELNYDIYAECKKRMSKPFSIGENIITPGLSTGFPYITHCVIMDANEISPNIQSIGIAIYNAILALDEKGCQSISIAPMIFENGEIRTERYIQALIISLLTLQEEYGISNIKYILIHIFDDLSVSLQDLLEDINN